MRRAWILCGGLAAFAILVAPLGCSGGIPAVGGRARASEELDIDEAVLRHQVGPGGPAKRYYLSIAGTDPDPAFLDRLRDLHIVWKPGSHAEIGKSGLMIDPSSGKNVMRLSIGPITWKSADSAEVKWEASDGLMGSSWATLVLKKREGKWQVVEMKDRRVS